MRKGHLKLHEAANYTKVPNEQGFLFVLLFFVSFRELNITIMQLCIKANKINAFRNVSLYVANRHLDIFGTFQIMTILEGENALVRKYNGSIYLQHYNF